MSSTPTQEPKITFESASSTASDEISSPQHATTEEKANFVRRESKNSGISAASTAYTANEFGDDNDDTKLDRRRTSTSSPVDQHIDQHKAENDIERAITHHEMIDPNLDINLVKRAEHALETGDYAEEVELEKQILEDSIYPEVRAAVSNVDDPDMPVNTFRMWLMTIVSVILLTGLNQFFSFRYPSVRVSPIVIQLLAYPVGVFLAKVLPTRVFKTPLGSFTLNPGPFNVKEHALIVICANVNSTPNSATAVLGVQKFTYQQDFGAAFQILFVLSSQLMGFSFAGLTRKWLVWPASMVWPATLVQTALLGAFHNQRKAEDGRMSRDKFFLIAFVCAFVYYWFPGYIFQALSIFNWACWIAPNNVKLNQLMGVQTGLGMGLLTFDWGQIASLGSPLAIPWFASAQAFLSYASWYWIIAPILYYTNTLYTANLPILDNQVFDRFGMPYDVSKVLNPDLTFNATMYNEYSTQVLPVSFALTYGLQFAALAAIIVQIALFYGPTVVRQFKNSIGDEPDIHARLMAKYPEVPNWWYGLTFLGTFGLALGAVCGWDTKHPWWALIVAIIISAIYILPIGIVFAITGLEISLGVLAELVGGYILPGRPVAVMIFKNTGFTVCNQAVAFIADMKFGHYMKVPPRLLFLAQFLSTILGCFVVLGVQAWSFENINGICTKHPTDGFQCPVITTSAASSIVWGLIGPALNFNPGKMYSNLLWFFFAGAIVPIPTYFYLKRYPKSFMRYASWPVIFLAGAAAAPLSGPNFFMFALVGFVFQFYLRRRHFRWWSSYNYVLGAALDAGTGLGIVIIFFTVIYPNGKNRKFMDDPWWGNSVFTKTLDAQAISYLTPDPQNGFMPAPGGTKYAA